ncbi:8-oxoguanine-DNA-glycosylase [Lachnospiraceae bacterium KM106-2]|nr:8-oxoguanine-DNA-glycosylase [Lachnospiraceae bacterium KM106-2]
MYQIQVEHFNIEQICYSGQCFRMRKNKRGYFEVVAFDRYLELKQEDQLVTFLCTKEEYEIYWQSYFSLDEDYDVIVKQIDKKDHYMTAAMNYGWGIRILKQDLWEMIISFLISQQNNIPRIQKCIQTICERYGEEKQNAYNEPYYTFPTPKSLAVRTENELRDCNLGYRAKYIRSVAQTVATDDFSLSLLSKLPYEEAKEELLKLYGIGIKVSECICLYGLHHLDAFPVDTHIKHVLDGNYKHGFPFEKYRGVAGVFQQYAFYYDLKPQIEKEANLK